MNLPHMRAVLRYDLPKHKDQVYSPASGRLTAPKPSGFDKNHAGITLRLTDYQILLSASNLPDGRDVGA